MTLLPVAVRELAVASRQSRTYMARLQAGLAALLLGGYFLLILNVTGVAGPGGMMAFTMFSGIAFYVCLFVGATATADAISSEKREGTLGLLFLTDLRAYDVLAGKLASHGLHLAYLLVATVPALAVPVLAGGVTARSLALQSLVLLNTLFFSCAVGLLVSTYSREARRARVMAFLMVLAILTLPFLVAFWGQERGWSASATVGIAFFSPASSLRAALAVTGFAAPFWPGFLITHGYAWLFLGLAAWRLPRSWQERPAGVKGQRWRAWWRAAQIGSGRRADTRRARLLAAGPFHYLGARSRLRHLGVWTVLALVLIVFVGMPAYFGTSPEGNLIFALGLCHLLAKGGLTSDAAATLLEHRKHGAFELLLSTPLSVREIIRGMWWALVTKFAGPVLVVLLGQAWLATDLVTKALGFADSGERWLAVATLAGVTVMLFCDLWALGWTAMWLAMSATNPNRATGDTIARILVLPWLLIGLGSAVLGVLVLTGFVPPGRLGPWTFFWIWFGLGLATDAFFGFRSRALLHERFRICAEQQFLATTPGAWSRLFRSLGKAWGRARLPAGR